MKNLNSARLFTVFRIAELRNLIAYILDRLDNLDSKSNKKMSLIIKNFEMNYLLRTPDIQNKLDRNTYATREEIGLCLMLLIREFFLDTGNPKSTQFIEKFIKLYRDDFKSPDRKDIEKIFLELNVELHKMEKNLQSQPVFVT
jgi:hypothetical protein